MNIEHFKTDPEEIRRAGKKRNLLIIGVIGAILLSVSITKIVNVIPLDDAPVILFSAIVGITLLLISANKLFMKN